MSDMELSDDESAGRNLAAGSTVGLPSRAGLADLPALGAFTGQFLLRLEDAEIPVDLFDEETPVQEWLPILCGEDSELGLPLPAADWCRFIGAYALLGKVSDALTVADAAIRRYKQHYQSHRAGPHALPSSHLKKIYSLTASIHIYLAQAAPKIHLPQQQQNKESLPAIKQTHFQQAAELMQLADQLADANPHIASRYRPQREEDDLPHLLAKALLVLKLNQAEEALRMFDLILAKQPTNVVALHAKARVLLARKATLPALKLYQDLLKLDPLAQPDPRIGIGLCLQRLGHDARARQAWLRSVAVRPNAVALTLLAISDLNLSKVAAKQGRLDDQAHHAASAVHQLQKAFTLERLPMTAAMLAAFILQSHPVPHLSEMFMPSMVTAAGSLDEKFNRAEEQHLSVRRLTEYAIQYADSRPVVLEAYASLARLAHEKDGLNTAFKEHYKPMLDKDRTHAVGLFAQALCDLARDDRIAAKHHLDALHDSQPDNSTIAVVYAAVNASKLEGFTADENLQNRLKARDILDRELRLGALDDQGVLDLFRLHSNARDWVKGKATLGLRYQQVDKNASYFILNNLGALEDVPEQKFALLTQASQTLDRLKGSEQDDSQHALTVRYNLARAKELIGNTLEAETDYRAIIDEHPEYLEARGRLASILIENNNPTEGHLLLKSSCTSQPSNAEMAAHYAHFFLTAHYTRPTKNSYNLTAAFLKRCLGSFKYDNFFLCAYARITYDQARNEKSNNETEQKRRFEMMRRAVECYDKALQMDSKCTIAAQGIAIAIVEDVLTSGTSDSAGRLQNIRDALDIFGRVRDSQPSAYVYINIGHCHYLQNEFDRAIEAYETASTKYFEGQDAQSLIYLSRAHYAKAVRESNYVGLMTALQLLYNAAKLNPKDMSTIFNIALVQQRTAQIMIDLTASKKTVTQLRAVFGGLEEAQKAFSGLAQASNHAGYDRNLADQRSKFGEAMLRKMPEYIQQQEAFEANQSRSLEAQRIKREQDLRNEQNAIDKATAAESAREAERAIARDQARKKAYEHSMMMRAQEDSMEETKREKANRAKAARDEKRRIERSQVNDNDASSASEESSEEGDSDKNEDVADSHRSRKPPKRVTSDGEDEAVPTNPSKRSKKAYMSSEFVGSDDESD